MAARSLGRLHQLCSQLCAAAGSVADDRQLISHLDDDEDEKQRLAFQQYCEEGKLDHFGWHTKYDTRSV